MKKISKLIGMFFSILVILIVMSPILLAEDINVKDNTIINKIDINSSTSKIKYSPKDYDILGPESIALNSKGSCYLLDNSENQVISMNSDEITKLDNISGAKICVDENDNLYVLDVAKGVIAKNDKQENRITQYALSNPRVEGVNDFGVNSEDNVYISFSNENGGKTDFYKLAEGKAIQTKETEGKIASNGVNFKTLLIKDSDLNVGHGCIITIFDAKGNTAEELTIKSEHHLL